MPESLRNGLELVIAVQSLGRWLELPMNILSQLGTEPFYLLIMPIVLWCYDYSLGFRLALILSASALSNSMLKLAFAMPRPFWISSRVQALSFETSFGLPSGHSQNAVSIWGRLAKGFGRRSAYYAAGLLILAISFSRIYLGVHYPLDVLAGWLAGGILLLIFLSFERPLWHWFTQKSGPGQVFVILLATITPLFLGLVIWAISMTQPLPANWMRLASAAASSTEEFADPRSFQSILSVSGVLFGMLLGAWQLYRQGGFKAAGSFVEKGARFALGAVGVALLFFGLDFVGLPQESVVGQAWRFFRYAIVGYWIAYLAPRLFFFLNLATRPAPSSHKIG